MPLNYLDHNAAAPLRPEARRAMDDSLDDLQANPSSVHGAGRALRRRIDTARREVAMLLGASPHEITFAGSGTEACLLAIHGMLDAGRGEIPLVLSTPIEHAAIRDVLDQLAFRGDIRLLLAPVGPSGRVHADWFAGAMAENPALAVCQWANNETGVIQPVTEIGTLCRAFGIPFLVDAIQWAGRGAIDLGALPMDLLVLSSPKLGGPTGVGALFVREGIRFASPFGAGGQEGGLRGGTENVSGVAGFGAAAAAVATSWERDAILVSPLIARVIERVLSIVPGARLVGSDSPRLANTAQFLVPHDDEEILILSLDRLGFAVSAGSACAAGAHRRSAVLAAMGVLAPGLASVRVSIGPETTAAMLDEFAVALGECVAAVLR